jgi:predicted RNA binding protein YcfA (HicA-like mRNA interferase family)
MSKKDKPIERFMSIPAKKDITFDELSSFLVKLGFDKIEGDGSAVKFYHKEKDLLINLHRPHPGNILKVYLVKQIQTKLKEFINGNN